MAYGPVQIGLTVTSHRIVKVTILQQPTATAHDLQIGQFAFPRLEAETLSAQSAKIDMVSGATYTRGGLHPVPAERHRPRRLTIGA